MNELFTFFGVVSHNHYWIYLTHMLFATAIVMFLAKKAINSMRLVPVGFQNVMEAYLGGVLAMGRDTIGKDEARRYLPLVATLGLFVVVSNFIGIVPGFESPSSFLDFTLALAISIFVYYNYEGIRRNGVAKYFGHFSGPVWWLAWLMFPIEIISHISRIISLSFRLFGNIKGDDLFLAVVLMLAPWFAPLPAFALLTFSGVLQAFIIMILTYVYLAGAVHISEDH
ncbi:F0F1-type ATP synthase, alpha subunit [Thiovulum sp. ES]|jgi:F-type H+-transporting ATPase subunit a|nr:F0F1-type ATP synthase, alpha subunit [Thiovulum sp. ES]